MIEKMKKELKMPKVPKLPSGNFFSNMNVLSKLRLISSLIFVLITLSFVLMAIQQWVIGALCILLGYLLIFALTVKLLLVKKL